ncbi:MAG: S4 domain-containing protein [Pseudomonadota bacterium]
MTDAIETVRLDVWLWRARFFKTRALASRQISARGVRLTRYGETRRVTKPGATVTAGDQVTFVRAKAIEAVEILALGTRRGPAAEAEALYRRLGEGDV